MVHPAITPKTAIAPVFPVIDRKMAETSEMHVPRVTNRSANRYLFVLSRKMPALKHETAPTDTKIIPRIESWADPRPKG
jgi:hypothetical protein